MIGPVELHPPKSLAQLIRSHPWIVVAGIAALAGCASQSFMPGVSDAPMPGSNSSGDGANKRPQQWERFGEVAGWKNVVESYPSRGHGTGQFTAQLRTNPGAAESLDLLRPGKQMPVGTVLVAVHRIQANGVLDDTYVMEKKEAGYFPEGGDWDYLVATSQGQVRARGKLSTCARCHADAPVDFVFLRPKL